MSGPKDDISIPGYSKTAGTCSNANVISAAGGVMPIWRCKIKCDLYYGCAGFEYNSDTSTCTVLGKVCTPTAAANTNVFTKIGMYI